MRVGLISTSLDTIGAFTTNAFDARYLLVLDHLRRHHNTRYAMVRWRRREQAHSTWLPVFESQPVTRVAVRPLPTSYPGRSARALQSLARATPLSRASERTLTRFSTDVDVILALLHPELWCLGSFAWSRAPVVLFAEEEVGPQPWEKPRHPFNVALARLEDSRRRALRAHPERVVVISEKERPWAHTTFPESQIDVVPHFLDIDAWSKPVTPAEPRSDGVLVVNDMGTRRNSDGLTAIMQELSTVDVSGAVSRVDVISANPPPDSLFASSASRIRYVGPVDDPRRYYANAGIVLVPSFFVRGAKSTVLQGWATRRPVVTTTAAAESLDLAPNAAAVAAGPTPRAVAERLVQTARDPAIRSRLVAAGWERLVTHHSPRVGLGALNAVLERARCSA